MSMPTSTNSPASPPASSPNSNRPIWSTNGCLGIFNQSAASPQNVHKRPTLPNAPNSKRAGQKSNRPHRRRSGRCPNLPDTEEVTGSISVASTPNKAPDRHGDQGLFRSFESGVERSILGGIAAVTVGPRAELRSSTEPLGIRRPARRHAASYESGESRRASITVEFGCSVPAYSPAR